MLRLSTSRFDVWCVQGYLQSLRWWRKGWIRLLVRQSKCKNWKSKMENIFYCLVGQSEWFACDWSGSGQCWRRFRPETIILRSHLSVQHLECFSRGLPHREPGGVQVWCLGQCIRLERISSLSWWWIQYGRREINLKTPNSIEDFQNFIKLDSLLYFNKSFEEKEHIL